MSDIPTTASWERQRRTLLPAAMIGTTLEWYDMFVYAQASSLVFAALFFPKFSPLTGTLAAFATFGVGYIARPLGAIVFGHVGDRLGRKAALTATLVLMGAATVLIGVLPTFETAGVLAPTLLVVLRLLQGLGSGAEYSGSFVMVSEVVPPARRGYLSSLPGIGIYAGLLLATIVGLTVFRLPEAQLYSWGWRLPFLASFVLIIVGLVMRLRIAESPVFADLARRRETHSAPIVEVFRRSPRRLVLTFMLTVPIAFNAYVASTYSLTYGVAQGVSGTGVLVGSLVGAAVAIVTTPIAGRLSDRFGRRPVYITMTACAALSAVPYFMLLNTGQSVPYWLAQALIIAPFTQGLTGAQAAFLAEQFEPAYRLTGVALSREFSTAALSSVAPIVALGLVAALGGRPWLLAGAMALASVIGLVAAVLLPETLGSDMHSAPGEVPTVEVDALAPSTASSTELQ